MTVEDDYNYTRSISVSGSAVSVCVFVFASLTGRVTSNFGLLWSGNGVG